MRHVVYVCDLCKAEKRGATYGASLTMPPKEAPYNLVHLGTAEALEICSSCEGAIKRAVDSVKEKLVR